MLRAERQSARMSKITNDGGFNPVWQRMVYSCTNMATVGVKGSELTASVYRSSSTMTLVRTRGALTVAW